MGLCSLLWVALLELGSDQVDPEGPVNPMQPMILCWMLGRVFYSQRMRSHVGLPP